MGTQRTRAYFTSSPQTSDYHLFSASNIPNQQAFEDLFASAFFKLEITTDGADVGQLGVLKVVSDADALARVSNGNVPGSVPHEAVLAKHLPLIFAGTTEMDYNVAAANYQGLTYQVIEGDVTGRASFKITFNPNTLSAKASPISADSIVLVDSEDSNVPKKVLLSDLLTLESSLWERTGTLIEPVNANDDLDIGTGDFGAADITLEGSADRSISLSDYGTNGKRLFVTSGGGTVLGGDMHVYAGTGSAPGAGGGQLYIFGGYGDTYGNLHACWDGLVKVGAMGIGGAALTANQLTVYGKVKIASGGLELVGYGTSVPTKWLGVDGSNVVQGVATSELITTIFGTANTGDIFYDNGIAEPIKRLPIGTAGEVLSVGSGNVPEWVDASSVGDKYVAMKSGSVPNYLNMVLGAGEGLKAEEIDDNTMGIAMDMNGLTEATTISKTSYIVIYQGGHHYKLPYGFTSGTKDAGWNYLAAGTDYTDDVTVASEITCADLTGFIEAGMPIKFKCTGDTEYRYALISAITASKITIQGDPLVVSVNSITELYYGGKEKVISMKYPVDVTNYNATDTDTALETLKFMKAGDRWSGANAKLVKFEVINLTNDGAVDPKINVGIGLAGLITDFVSTADSGNGIACTTTINTTGIDIDPDVNSISYGDNIEIRVVKGIGANGTAGYLTVFGTFILK